MYILIDIGGTKTRVTLTEHREAFLPPVIFETPQDFGEWVTALKEATKPFHNGNQKDNRLFNISLYKQQS